MSGGHPTGVVWTNPKSWDKATKDKVLIGVSAIIAILAVIFFPTGGSEPAEQPIDPNKVVQQEDQADAEPGQPAMQAKPDAGEQ